MEFAGKSRVPHKVEVIPEMRQSLLLWPRKDGVADLPISLSKILRSRAKSFAREGGTIPTLDVILQGSMEEFSRSKIMEAKRRYADLAPFFWAYDPKTGDVKAYTLNDKLRLEYRDVEKHRFSEELYAFPVEVKSTNWDFDYLGEKYTLGAQWGTEEKVEGVIIPCEFVQFLLEKLLSDLSKNSMLEMVSLLPGKNGSAGKRDSVHISTDLKCLRKEGFKGRIDPVSLDIENFAITAPCMEQRRGVVSIDLRYLEKWRGINY